MQNQALQKGGGIYLGAQTTASITVSVCTRSVVCCMQDAATKAQCRRSDYRVCLQEEVSISSNRAADGAGVYAKGASLTMYGTVSVSDNTATGYVGGGGMYLLQSTMLVPASEELTAIVFRANTAKSGVCVWGGGCFCRFLWCRDRGIMLCASFVYTHTHMYNVLKHCMHALTHARTKFIQA